jgi:phospho-N-acetylmuramoyl-pentapeptide-transferase
MIDGRKWLIRAALAAAAALAIVLIQMWLGSVFRGPRGIMEQLTLRMAAAAVLSFGIVVAAGPRMIRFLLRQKLGDRPEFDHAALNELTRHKSATPTMGGVLIAVAIFVASYLFADVGSMYVRMALLALVWLGVLGAWDDWLKLRAAAAARKGEQVGRHGLRSWEKILFQIALAVLLATAVYQHGSQSDYADFEGRVVNAVHSFYLPFRAAPIYLPLGAFVAVTILVMVGSSNAVNLTDGMDGLAAGCMVFVTGVFLVLSWVTGNQNWANFLHLPFVPQAAELAVVCAAMIGACIGFLWFNCLPAQVFMGDTGSLPLGGLIGYIAVVTRQELMLFIAGGVFVMEAVSVVLQIGYFKSTGGKRLFRVAPIHHHFHLGGWAESKVVVRFWLMSILFAAIALATLKLR